MHLAPWFEVAVTALPGLLWMSIALGAWRLRQLPVLERPAGPDPGTWPRLSVVIAARDEAHTIEPALASLLAQDYPGLEIVLVDDRSTDGTREAIDRMAAAGPSVGAASSR